MKNELAIPPQASRDKASFELLRVWIANGGQHVSLRPGTWQDPLMWGMFLADLARHIVNAEQQVQEGFDAETFLERMLEGFDSEMNEPTDEAEGEVQ